MIDLGPLDRYGVLYSRAPVTAKSGAITYTETKIGELYLTAVAIPTHTVIAAMKDSESTSAIFKARWFEGLANGMILRVEGDSYRITRRDQLGRRQGWQIYGAAYQ